MIVWIAGIGAIICLVYYGVILLYAGVSVSYSWIWLAGAGFFCLVLLEEWYRQRHPKKIPLWATVAVRTFLGASLVIFLVVEVLIFWGAAGGNSESMDYVIVLGARVGDGRISNSLRARLDKAIEYSRNNPGTTFILSGGQSYGEPLAEAQVMYDYLLYNGVPAQQMVMETISTSTVENIAYSKVVIDQMERRRREEMQNKGPVIAPGPFLRVEEKPIQTGLLTSSYHLFRAKETAEKWGISNIHGIAAKSDLILLPHFCVRECLAILKDKLMGNM
ncbi:MAG: YdcF family protein [Hungatella sp.]|nr:YdcF family protein [Hungatella sp.]